MSDRKKLETAKQLIKEGNYVAARALLLTVDHPIAHRMLAALDRLEAKQKSKAKRKRDEEQEEGRSFWVSLLLNTVILVAAMVGVIVLGRRHDFGDEPEPSFGISESSGKDGRP